MPPPTRPPPPSAYANAPAPPPGGRKGPEEEDLLGFFAHALEDHRSSGAAFTVLCSLPPPTEGSGSGNGNGLALAPAPPRSRPRNLLVLDSSFNPPTRAHLRMAVSAARDPRYHSPSPPDGEGGGVRVLLLLATSNADKAPRPAAFPHRLAMMYGFARDLTESLSGSGSGGGIVVDIGVTTQPYFHSKSAAVAESPFYHRPTTGEEEKAPQLEPDMLQVYLTGFDTLIRIFNPKYYPGPSSTSTDTSTSAMAASLDPFFARARLRVTARVDADAGDDWGDAEAQNAYLEGLRRGALVRVGGRTEWADRVELDAQGKEEEGAPPVSSTRVRDAVVRGDWDVLRSLVSVRVAAWIREHALYRE